MLNELVLVVVTTSFQLVLSDIQYISLIVRIETICVKNLLKRVILVSTNFIAIKWVNIITLWLTKPISISRRDIVGNIHLLLFNILTFMGTFVFVGMKVEIIDSV